MICRLLFLVICLSIFSTSLAGDKGQKMCKLNKLGWHFYCDPDKDRSDHKTKKEPAPKPNSPEDYIAKRDAIRKELEWKLARAVLEPTYENIIAYIRSQRDKALNPSNEFTNKWKRAIWTTPDLDYTLKHPVSTIGKQAWTDNFNIIKNKTINKLNERYGVFFFYNASCIYCQKYSPILKAFTDKHNMNVMAVSFDGGILPQWPNTVINNGQAEKMGIAGKPVPATVLFDKKANKAIPVGFGLIATDELEHRIYTMTKSGDR